MSMQFNILTIFPNMITSYTKEGILHRGEKAGVITIRPINIRDFTDDKRKTVDDTPYGGGAGMLMKPEPIYKALTSINAIPFKKDTGLTKLKKVFNGDIKKKKRTVLLSPRGRQFDQSIAETWATLDELTLICGRYEGIDQRVIDHMIDEEISVGPYVLAGGELGALTITEAISRLIPGVLGNPASLEEESIQTIKNKKGVKDIDINPEYPQYTKPADFLGWRVPAMLLSGDHKKIQEWRKEHTGKKNKKNQ